MNPYTEGELLRPELKQAVAKLGFTEPTPIQAEVIPAVLESDGDLIALARTGTGKTAAFGLPLVQRIDDETPGVQALILCPTRELCLQIARDLKAFSKFRKPVKILAVYGGASIRDQIKGIEAGANIVVGTPGRTLDLINRKKLSVDSIRTLVLDEADEMLNMGFQEELNGILEATPEEKQTLLFSATMPKEARRISEQYMHEPKEISAGHEDAGNSRIEHIYYKIKSRDRFRLLRLLTELHPEMYAVIFCRTRREVDEIAKDLRTAGHPAEALHGDMSQAQRDAVMQNFRQRQTRLLVATDVAARGLDVTDLTHVVNYKLPDAPEVYVHRSGRTGRAGKEGTAISLLTSAEFRKLKAIQRYANIEFTQAEPPTEETIYRHRALRFANKLRAAELEDDKLTGLLPDIAAELEDLDRDALLRHIVAYGLSDFSAEVSKLGNVQTSTGRSDRERSGGRRNRDNGSYQKIVINVGRNQGYTVPQILGMLNSKVSGPKVDLGHIDLQSNLTFIDVDQSAADRVIGDLDGAEDKGKRVGVRKYTKEGPRKKFGRKRAFKKRG